MTYLPGLRASLVQAARRTYAETPEPPRRRWLPAGLIATGLAATVAVAVAVVAIVALGHRRAASTSVASPGSTVVALRRAAERTLQQVVLPPGAVLSGLVRGTPAQLWSPSSRLAIANQVDVYRVWRLPETPDRVISYMLEHPPRGGSTFGVGTQAGVGAPGGPFEVLRSTTTISFAGGADGVWRELALDAVALKSGGTALRVDSEAEWLAPRPAGERIPPGVTRVTILWDRLGRRPQLYGGGVITSRRRVQAAVSLLNSTPLAEPGTSACRRAPSATVRFILSAGASKTPLAVAVWDPPCASVSLTIARHSPLRLMAGYPTSPAGAQLAELLAQFLPPTRVTSVRRGPTTVNSQSCTSPPPSSAPSQSAPGAAGASCTSVNLSATSGSVR